MKLFKKQEYKEDNDEKQTEKAKEIKEIEETEENLTIVCPHCNNAKLTFVTEYHKSWGRVFAIIFAALAIYFLLFDNVLKQFIEGGESDSRIYFLICAIATIVCMLTTVLTERRTHIKAICQVCGNIWFID